MASKMFRLNVGDLGRGLVTAVFAALITWLYGIVNSPTFEIAQLLAVDWGEVLKMAMTAGVAYLGKNLFSDSEGKLFGKIG